MNTIALLRSSTNAKGSLCRTIASKRGEYCHICLEQRPVSRSYNVPSTIAYPIPSTTRNCQYGNYSRREVLPRCSGFGDGKWGFSVLMSFSIHRQMIQMYDANRHYHLRAVEGSGVLDEDRLRQDLNIRPSRHPNLRRHDASTARKCLHDELHQCPLHAQPPDLTVTQTEKTAVTVARLQ